MRHVKLERGSPVDAAAHARIIEAACDDMKSRVTGG
jgi:hypothetical protein